MKRFIGILLLIPELSVAATPFTVSGEKLQAIFSDTKIWSTVNGEIQSIKYMGHQSGQSKYEFITLEKTKKTRGEIKILKKPMKCRFRITVVNQGDALAPKWAVKSSDFSKCPVGPPFM